MNEGIETVKQFMRHFVKVESIVHFCHKMYYSYLGR